MTTTSKKSTKKGLAKPVKKATINKEKEITEISKSIKKSFSKKYLKDFLK